jgi:hypothetical protein
VRRLLLDPVLHAQAQQQDGVGHDGDDGVELRQVAVEGKVARRARIVKAADHQPHDDDHKEHDAVDGRHVDGGVVAREVGHVQRQHKGEHAKEQHRQDLQEEEPQHQRASGLGGRRAGHGGRGRGQRAAGAGVVLAGQRGAARKGERGRAVARASAVV